MKIYQLSRQLLSTKKNHTLRPIVRITLMGMQLGVAVMVLAFAVTAGYKCELREKLSAVGSDVKISTLQENQTFENQPFQKTQPFISALETHPNVTNFQYVATKLGVIKAADQVAGILCKGIDDTYDTARFSPLIVEGRMPSFSNDKLSNEILISKSLSKKLALNVGDKVTTYFVQDPPRQRRFTISGFYNTYLPEFDNTFVFIDIQHVQRLNNWDSTMVSAIEISINKPENIASVAEELFHEVGYELKTESIQELYPHVFAWIDLFDTNVVVLLVITIIICIITIVSTFFIIILEHVKTVGIFKTLGFTDKSVFQLFLVTALRLILKGMLLGNILALVLGFLQIHFELVTLNPEIYYVPSVPLQFNVLQILLLNIGVILVCITTVTLPAWLVAKKISPIVAIRYD